MLQALILMLAFTLQVITGVLTQGKSAALDNWIHVDSLSAIFLGLIAIVGDFSWYLFYRLYRYVNINEGHLDLERLIANYYGFLHLFFFTMITICNQPIT